MDIKFVLVFLALDSVFFLNVFLIQERRTLRADVEAAGDRSAPRRKARSAPRRKAAEAEAARVEPGGAWTPARRNTRARSRRKPEEVRGPKGRDEEKNRNA